MLAIKMTTPGPRPIFRILTFFGQERVSIAVTAMAEVVGICLPAAASPMHGKPQLASNGIRFGSVPFCRLLYSNLLNIGDR